MKKLLLIVATAIGLITPPALRADHSCDRKLDALSKTVLDLVTGAAEIQTELTLFVDTCCDRVRSMEVRDTEMRSENRAPSCSCETTPITEAGTLQASGAYCLANDITGNIDATGLQVKINLNGHKLTGNVTVGPNSYLYGGSVTERVTVDSFSRVEKLTIKELHGLSSTPQGVVGVLVNNVSFLGNAVVHGFNSITLDETRLQVLTIEIVKNIIVRNSQIALALIATDQSLETFAMYDSSVASDVAFTFGSNLRSFGLWHSSFGNVTVTFTGGGTFSPVISLYGSTFEKLSFNSGVGPQLRSTVLIDECACDNLYVSGMKNMRIQNMVASTQTEFTALSLVGCEQVSLDHVQAYNKQTNSVAYAIANCKNILLKQCFGSAVEGVSSAFRFLDPIENLNLFECEAKRSYGGFDFNSTAITGTVIGCIVDGCSNYGFQAPSGIQTVFIGNVSVNNAQDYSGGSGVPFNPSSDPTTAVSWRNMNS